LRGLVPSLAVALAVGLVLALWLHPPSGPVLRGVLTLPVATAPTFTLGAFLSLALPMLLMVLSSQNATGIGVLWAMKYDPPVNAITVATGVFTMLTAPLGGHGVCLGGPRAAIAAAEAAHPDPHLRYGAVVVDAVLLLVGGLFATTLVSLFRLLPLGMIRVIAGLAMLPVIQQGLEQGFRSGRHRLGTLFALVIAASDVQWLGVSAVFWALALSPVLSRLAEGPLSSGPGGAAEGIPSTPDS
jgi:benzoate membrane transport protein